MSSLLFVLAQITATPPVPPQSIPRSWIIAAGIVAMIVLALLLRSALRAWRASNLFDRRYRFPPAPAARPRFGGLKCGGHLATIQFRSKREDG